MLKPRKRGDKWSIRVYDYMDADGKQHYKRITADTYDACKDAAKIFLAEKDKKKTAAPVLTVGEAVDQYIELCQVLSPATVAGYEKIRRTGFPDLWDVKVSDLTDQLAQEYVNRETVRNGRRGQISPKTVANEWALISSALWRISRVKCFVRLPQRRRSMQEYPEPAVVMNIVRGSNIELPCLLALWLSFSMSEIRGLKFSDVHGDVITVNRVIVDVDGVPTLKETAKTDTRLRRHRLPAYLKGLIEEADHSHEYIVPHNHDYIYYHFRKLMDEAGLDITFHALRHLNASVMLQLNVPEKYAMERGGWKTPTIMKSVYQHTFSAQRALVDDQIDAYFQDILDHGSDQKHDQESPTC